MAVDDSSSSPSFRELEDVFLQSQARIWIEEVLHTRFDDQLSIGDLLSDGELLFEVSKELWNMLLVKYMELKSYKSRMFVPVDTQKRSGKYRPYSNVDSFLKVCKVMGLNSVDLFSPSDVVEKRNIRKVCICIRSLSMKARSKQLNVPDFDIVTNKVAMPTDAVRCIRRNLELSSMSSVTCGRSKHARLKSRKLIFASPEQDDESSHLEESDEEQSQFSDTSSVDFLYLESGESPDTVDYKYTLTQHSDVSNRELYKVAHTPRSVLLQYVNENQLEEMFSNFFELGLIIGDEFTSVSPSSRMLGRVLDFDFDSKSDDSVKDDVTNIADSLQENVAGAKFSESYDSCVDAEDTSKAASKDERKDKNEKRERKPSYMAPLVKTVAKGTALIGILFLFQLRNSSAGNKNGRSGQIQWKSIGVGFLKGKEDKGKKIYPVEKFKFEI
ncbi:protein OPAQUE10-like [Bidens hawaiensis]|uniref:protein OPAQUE10-like n=1 Tax=Bidens hawaiensis TaxID=980011 RepID=UPI0040496543